MTRGRGTLLTLLGVVAALAIVAVAARGDAPIGEAGTRRPADGLLDVLFSLFVLLLGLGVVLFFFLILLGRNSITPESLVKRKQRRFVSLLVLGAILLALLLLVRFRVDTPRRFEIPTLVPPGGDANGAIPDEGRYTPQFAWIPALIVSVLVVGGIAAAWWSAAARKRGRGFDETNLAEALADVLEETLDDLRAEGDPRRAVIAAYARLERAVAAYGLPRHPAEAPLEYLARMLGELSVSRPAVRRLTLLFERAKFSQHDVGIEMKEEAIAALQKVQEELRAADLAAQIERAAALEAARARADAVTP
jgi:hypothetical protein